MTCGTSRPRHVVPVVRSIRPCTLAVWNDRCMPEGDTVYLAARRLREALAGRTLTRSDFRVPRYATVDLSGHDVDDVDQAGISKRPYVRVVQRLLCRRPARQPVELGPLHQVASIRERRLRFGRMAVHGPADVIAVQVGEHDVGDVTRRQSVAAEGGEQPAGSGEP